MLSPLDLQRRSLLLQAVRSFFVQRAYLEVDTPVRLPVLLPEAAILPLTSEGSFLQTSPELCMKRLLAQGICQIFQICPCFRRDEKGRLHNPEFTMLEWYHCGWDYEDLMSECEALIRFLAQECSHEEDGSSSSGMPCMRGRPEAWLIEGQVGREERRVALLSADPWERCTVEEAFCRYAPCSAHEALAQDRFDEILVEYVEPHLGWEQPTFLLDYPLELASLARPSAGNPQVAERFELYIAGIEIANGFSELVDADEQRQRFGKELELIKARETDRAEAVPDTMPEKFLADLAQVPETAGIALGLDRLFMLLMGKARLADALTFSANDL